MTDNQEHIDTVLIICRSPGEIGLLRRIRRSDRVCYVVASDDIRVHNAVARISWIKCCCWLEQMHSYFEVSSDVLKTLDYINVWLASIATECAGLPSSLFFWIRHCEGGMTTQRIQDVLLLICSYRQLLDRHAVKKVFVLKHVESFFEDEVLALTAKTIGIDVKTVGGCRIRVLRQRIWSYFEVFARAAYYLMNMMRLKLLSASCQRTVQSDQHDVVFQLCSSASKHVEDVIPLMRALKNRGYKPAALCWSSSERYVSHSGADQIRASGLQAEELEKWLSWLDIILTPYYVIRAWKKAVAHRDEIVQNDELQYCGVRYGILLWPSLRFFFLCDLLQRRPLYFGMNRYLEQHRPTAMKPWGSMVLPEGFMMADMVRNHDAVIFDCSFGVESINPYARKDVGEMLDLFLTTGPINRDIVTRNNDLSPEKIVMVGESRYDYMLETFRSGVDASLGQLGIKATYEYYVLYEPGYVLRGVKSVAEYVLATQALLEFAAAHQNIALIVKPHPAGQIKLLKNLLERSQCENVYLLDRRDLPYHALNVSDIVLTKRSAVALEGMLFGKPIISIILDQEERFKAFRDAVEYVYSAEDLKALLEAVFRSRKTFDAWSRSRLLQQREFCEEYFYRGALCASEMAAAAIDDVIRSRSSVCHYAEGGVV